MSHPHSTSPPALPNTNSRTRPPISPTFYLGSPTDTSSDSSRSASPQHPRAINNHHNHENDLEPMIFDMDFSSSSSSSLSSSHIVHQNRSGSTRGAVQNTQAFTTRRMLCRRCSRPIDQQDIGRSARSGLCGQCLNLAQNREPDSRSSASSQTRAGPNGIDIRPAQGMPL